MAASGQVYSCTLEYSVRAEGGRIAEWGSWSGLFSDGPGMAMARAYGNILIDTGPDASTPVRMFGKLKGARDRIRKERGKCEGRKAHSEINPAAVALAKRLHRASPRTGERMSLRRISAALEEAGHVNEHGRPFNPNSIKSMVERKTTR
jgi:hypothetical protein